MKETFFNELEDLHKMEDCSAPFRVVDRLFAGRRSTTRVGLGQADSSHGLFFGEHIEDAVIFMRSSTAFGKHGQISFQLNAPLLKRERPWTKENGRRRGD